MPPRSHHLPLMMRVGERELSPWVVGGGVALVAAGAAALWWLTTDSVTAPAPAATTTTTTTTTAATVSATAGETITLPEGLGQVSTLKVLLEKGDNFKNGDTEAYQHSTTYYAQLRLEETGQTWTGDTVVVANGMPCAFFQLYAFDIKRLEAKVGSEVTLEVALFTGTPEVMNYRFGSVRLTCRLLGPLRLKAWVPIAKDTDRVTVDVTTAFEGTANALDAVAEDKRTGDVLVQIDLK